MTIAGVVLLPNLQRGLTQLCSNRCTFKALCNPSTTLARRILELLRERDMTAGELAEHFDLAKRYRVILPFLRKRI
jgi:hypothetical protein